MVYFLGFIICAKLAELVGWKLIKISRKLNLFVGFDNLLEILKTKIVKSEPDGAYLLTYSFII